MLERLLEEPGEAIHEELDERDLEASEEDVELLAEKYNDKIELLRQELEKDLQLISEETDSRETGEEPVPNGSGSVERYEARGVEYAELGDVEVKLVGQNTDVHPEAVVLAEKAGEVEEDEFELEYQQRYQARKSLEDQGLIEDEQIDDAPREIIEEAVTHVSENLEDTGNSVETDQEAVENNSVEVKEEAVEQDDVEESGPADFDYEFQEDTLVIETSDETYEILARHNGSPSNELEMLGYIAGMGDNLVSWYHDRDTDSEFLSEHYFQAFSELEDEGLASGSDHEGFELEIDLPESLRDDLKQELRRDYSNRGETYEGTVIGMNGEKDLKIKYDEGVAFVKDYNEMPQMGTEVEVVEKHEEDGRMMAELA
jgi:hypothetical protein